MIDRASTSRKLALSPLGGLHLVDGGPQDALLAPQVLQRIERAFAKGQGHGLLQLGVAELQTELSPSLAFWRELARRFMTRVCAIGDLEACREKLSVDPAEEDLEELASSAPQMIGGEYLSVSLLAQCWREIEEALRGELASFQGTVSDYLRKRSSLWNLVGRVCFHMVENKRDSRAPFAFLATYASRLSAQARVQHQPLSRALQEFAGAGNRSALLALLKPVQRAAAESSFLKELVDSKAIFHPLSWSSREAYCFLRDIPLFEKSGVMVRVPDWWQPRRRLRPQVRVTIGSDSRTRLGVGELLDFSVDLVLDGEPISEEEWQQLLAGTEELALIRGRWVEIDRQKLEQVLAHWRDVQQAVADEGVSFVEGMRLLSGAGIDDSAEDLADEDVPQWSEVVSGEWLAKVLTELKKPQGPGHAVCGDELRASLRPYQQEGVHWLWYLNNLGLGACLADDMGLGKTIQVLALLMLIRRREANRPSKERRPSLLVMPTSLIANWNAEISRFTPSLRTLIAHPSAMASSEVKKITARQLAKIDAVITSYGSLSRLPKFARIPWELVVLDEAQAIKNPQTKQARAAKALQNLDELPLPVYDPDTYPALQGDEKIKIGVLDESRGCPNRCAFCIHPIKSGGKWCLKSPQRVIEEMRRLGAEMGTRYFLYSGSNTSARVAVGIAQEIVRNGLDVHYGCFGHARGIARADFDLLRRSGCEAIFYGLESGSPRILRKAFNKPLDLDLVERVIRDTMDAGIYAITSVIFPAPFEDDATRAETLDFLRRLRPDSVPVTIPGLIPGTPWDTQSQKYGFEKARRQDIWEYALTYKIKLLFPPAMWKPLPYRLNGKTSRRLFKECTGFVRALEADGILTHVPHELVLMAHALGEQDDVKGFRDRCRARFLSGASDAIGDMVERINRQVRLGPSALCGHRVPEHEAIPESSVTRAGRPVVPAVPRTGGES